MQCQESNSISYSFPIASNKITLSISVFSSKSMDQGCISRMSQYKRRKNKNSTFSTMEQTLLKLFKLKQMKASYCMWLDAHPVTQKMYYLPSINAENSDSGPKLVCLKMIE